MDLVCLGFHAQVGALVDMVVPLHDTVFDFRRLGTVGLLVWTEWASGRRVCETH